MTVKPPANAPSANTKRAYAAGKFECKIDGGAPIGFIKTVSGGSIKATALAEPVGAENYDVKHTTYRQTSEVQIDVGMALSKQFLTWIKDCWNKKYSRRNGSITWADFDYWAKHEMQFKNALITEVVFPAFDATAKDAAYLTVKIMPEEVEMKRAARHRVAGALPGKQKLWSPRDFRFTLDGKEFECTKYVNKIESFTIKQTIKQLYTGESLLPQIEPVGVTFPDISFQLAAEYADPFLDWHNKAIIKGMKDSQQEKTGSITMLAPNRRDELLTVSLDGVGILNAEFMKADVTDPKIQRVKVNLYVEKMDIQLDKAKGFHTT